MEAKVTALEEEIGILKGEIKSILQEVRTAVLASENPFSGGATTHVVSAAPAAYEPEIPEPRVLPVIQFPTIVAPPSAQSPPAPSARTLTEELTDEDEDEDEDLDWGEPRDVAKPPPRRSSPDRGARSPRQDSRAPVRQPEVSRQSPEVPDMEDDFEDELEADAGPRLDVRALAGLVIWVEETRHRLDDSHLRIVLSLARYGEMLDAALEQVLLDVSSLVEASPGRSVSVNDCLVALRQLDAVLNDAGAEEPTRISKNRRRSRQVPTRTEVQRSRRR